MVADAMSNLSRLTAGSDTLSQGLRVLFVDDDLQVLKGLQRMLYPRRHDWQLRYATNGAAALQIMADDPADLVIADMRMPGMDGATLLQQVRQDWPGTIRYILSGHAEAATLLSAFGVAHRFFAKPCDSQLLAAAMDQGLELQAQIAGSGISEAAFVRSLRAVPAAPWRALLEQIDTDPTDRAAIADRLAVLPEVAVRLMQVSNSSLFSAAGSSLDLEQVVARLGAPLCRAILADAGLFEPLAADDPRHADRLRGGRIAATARDVAARMARDLSLSPADTAAAQAAAMIQRLGSTADGDGGKRPHALVLALWGLPRSLADGIRPDPMIGGPRLPPSLPATIGRMADVIAASIEDCGELPTLYSLVSCSGADLSDCARAGMAVPGALIRRYARRD